MSQLVQRGPRGCARLEPSLPDLTRSSLVVDNRRRSHDGSRPTEEMGTSDVVLLPKNERSKISALLGSMSLTSTGQARSLDVIAGSDLNFRNQSKSLNLPFTTSKTLNSGVNATTDVSCLFAGSVFCQKHDYDLFSKTAKIGRGRPFLWSVVQCDPL